MHNNSQWATGNRQKKILWWMIYGSLGLHIITRTGFNNDAIWLYIYITNYALFIKLDEQKD